MRAMRAESTRLIWPAPTPSVMPPPQKTMALLFTNLATFQANSRSSICAAVGASLVTTRSSARATFFRSRRLQQHAAADALEVQRIAAGAQRHLEHAQVLLGGEQRARLGREAGRDQHLDELLVVADLARGGFVDRPVEGDDAAEGRGRVGLPGLGVGLDQVRADGHAAGVGMLDDDAGRRVEGLDAFPGRVGVGDVVVAELLALQLRPARQQAVRRAGLRGRRPRLVRVLAVAQVLRLRQLQVVDGGEGLARRHRGHLRFGAGGQRAQVVGDHAVVGGDVGEDLHRQHEARRRAAPRRRAQLGEHARVVGRVDQHRHVGPVLGRGAQHRRAADVDVLDRVFQRAVGPRGGLRTGTG